MLIEGIYSLLAPINPNTYPGVAEQEVEAPFIVHAVAKTIPYPSKDGRSTLDEIIYKIASYDKTQTDAQLQADSVRNILDEYSGYGHFTADNTIFTIDSTQYGADYTGVNFKIRFVDEETGFEPSEQLYFTLQTYRIWITNN